MSDARAGLTPFRLLPDHWTFYAERLYVNGYAPIPTHFGTKSPIGNEWQRRDTRGERWANAGVGLITVKLPTFDIDSLDANFTLDITTIITRICGSTLMRIGRAPKLLLPYRLTGTPFSKLKLQLAREGGIIEVLADGQQFIAFGVHPDGFEYRWVAGSPLDHPYAQLPGLSKRQAHQVLEQIRKAHGGALIEEPDHRRAAPRAPTPGESAQGDVILKLLHDLGFYQRPAGREAGKHEILCPWAHEHTPGRDQYRGAAYWSPSRTNGGAGGFKCTHAHCLNRHITQFTDAIVQAATARLRPPDQGQGQDVSRNEEHEEQEEHEERAGRTAPAPQGADRPTPRRVDRR